MTQPHALKATIVIAAYNAATTIGRAVRSALAEPEVAEVCVVDDASTDDTVAVARRCDLGDGRLMVLAQPANAGPSAARNVAIDATRSPWIGVLDADDYLLPGRTAALLAQAADVDFVADPLIRVQDGAPAPTIAQAIPQATPTPAILDFESFVLGNLTPARNGLEYGYLKPLMSRSFLDAHAIRYRPGMRLGEDYEIYARALAHGARFRLVPPAGYISVEREGSLSRTHSERDLRELRDSDLALETVRPLSTGELQALRRHASSVDCRLQWRLLINAVKARDVGASIRTFRSPPVALYLATRLGEQAWLRGRALAARRSRGENTSP
jgi:succinoglycan biosynthesis protein ExoU